MSIKKGDTVEVLVNDLAYGGKGVAKVDGLVIFIRGGLPDEVLKVEIRQKKKSFAQAEIIEVIHGSNKRIKPVCSHFGLCGGCVWQNLEYETQLYYKAKTVEDSLKHLGGFSDFECLKICGSQDIYFYRNKMEFSFGKGSAQELIIGLHPFQNFRVVFNLGKCFLQSELSNQIVEWTRDFCRREDLTAYDIKEHKGFLRYLAIREAKDRAEIMVNLITYYEKFEKSENFALGLIQHFPSIKSVVQNVNPKLATIACGEKEIILGGKKTIREKTGNLYFEISANSFFQTNSKQAERLFDIILEFADLEGSEKVLDLYSGTGAISLLLSGKAKEIIGIESVKDSVENAQRNAELNSVENCRFFLGEAKEVLSSLIQEGYSPKVVVVDPPRSGMHKKVVSSVLQLNPERIIYVSCNPTTLARDLKILCEKGYILEKVQPIDMFPQTYHIESVAKLVKKRLA